MIDGLTQPGYDGALLIELNGALAGSGANGLTVDAGDSTVKGLVVNRFGNAGILLEKGSGNTIVGNYLGTDRTGTLALGNSLGVKIVSGGSNVIGGTEPQAGNLISGNGNVLGAIGVEIDSGSGNRVEGNYIGTDVTGTLALRNITAGIFIPESGSNNVIGGTKPHAGNLISGNGGSGVLILGGENRVEGNFIGTDVSGTQRLGNDFGVLVFGSHNTIGGTTPAARNIISGNREAGVRGAGLNRVEGNYIGTDVDGRLALPNNDGVVIVNTFPSSPITIGGTEPGAGNVISGNLLRGVYVAFFADGNFVQGNYIGTDASGTAPLANGQRASFPTGGVVVESSNNLIGGTSAAARNVISGNNGYGVAIVDAVSGNRVEGNFIGTDKTGREPLGNQVDGVAIRQGDRFFGGPSHNWIGGTAVGAGNIIAFNGGAGVSISSGVGNAILGNSIFSNVSLGIALGPGANHNQAAPVLTSAVSSGGVTTVQGTLTSTPNTTYTLEFFSNPDGPTSQGKTFLRRITVKTDATGKATFTATFVDEVGPGQSITATATDPLNDTSQFSNGRVVTGA